MARSDRQDSDHIQEKLREFVRRTGTLLTVCDEIERDGLVLVPDAEWIEVYRLLIEMHELLAGEFCTPAIAPHLLKLDLKLAVLEALVETAVGSLGGKILH